VLAVNLSWPSGRLGLYASLIGLSTAMGDCLWAGRIIAPALPSPAQSAVKGMSSHATDLAVYAESSSSPLYTKLKIICTRTCKMENVLGEQLILSHAECLDPCNIIWHE